MNLRGHFQGQSSIISTPQNFTDAWVDLGSEIDTRFSQRIGMWITLDINLSNNARIRLLAKHTSGGSEEYVLPIRTVGASDVKVEPEYIEWNNDSDVLMILASDLEGLIPYVQLQIQAGTVGGTPAQIDAAYYTLAY